MTLEEEEEEGSPAFVTAELIGGLGNQLFLIFAAVAHALRVGARPLFHELEASPSVTPRHTYWQTLLLGAPRAWLTPEAPEAARRHHCGPGYDAPPALPRRSSLRLEGYAMHWRYAGAEAPEVARRLGLFERLEEGQALLRRELADLGPCRVVAVHVRRGDYLRLRRWHRVLSPAYYARAARALAALLPRHENPWVLLLFSDEPDDAELAPVRAALEASFFPGAAVRRAAPRPGHGDAEEFAMMAACDAFVLANSTFSWWAARLAELRAAEASETAPLVCMPDVEHAELPGRSLPWWLRLSDDEALGDLAGSLRAQGLRMLDLREARAYLISPGRGRYARRCAEVFGRLVAFGFREVLFVRAPEHPEAARSLALANLSILEREARGDDVRPFAIFEDDCAFRPGAPPEVLLPLDAGALYLGVSSWVYPHDEARLFAGGQGADGRGHIRPCGPQDFEASAPGCVRLLGGTTSAHGILFASRRYVLAAAALLRRAEARGIPHDLALAVLQRPGGAGGGAVYALRTPLVYQDAALGGQEAVTRLRFLGAAATMLAS